MELAAAPDIDVLRRHLGAILDGIVGELKECAERSAVASGPFGTCHTSTPCEALQAIVDRAID